jgi:single-stranded DNA-binding protein
MREWQDREGNKRISAEVVADNVYFGVKVKKAAKAVRAIIIPLPAAVMTVPSPAARRSTRLTKPTASCRFKVTGGK